MNLIDELYALQDQHGFLRDDDLRALSARIKVPLYEIEGVASFYPHFRRTPPPKAVVSVCRDVSCCMAGGATDALRAVCEGRDDVELHEVSCLGRCDTAPAAAVNDVPVAPGDVAGFLDDLSTLPENEPTDAPREWPIDGEPYAVFRELMDSGDIDGLIAKLKDSGLRGMGGAGFPTGLKWELVRKEQEPKKYVICNADESEPGTFKDRVILEELPHLVIEGMLLGALTIGADEGWIYVRHEYVKETVAIRRAIQKAQQDGLLGKNILGSDFSFDLKVFVSPGGYILGEETALLEALEGKRGEPRNKPPYPGVQGLFGKPTLINNVESLASVAHIWRTGKQTHKFFSISGDVATPGVHCVEKGATLDDLVALCPKVRQVIVDMLEVCAEITEALRTARSPRG